MSFPGKRRWLVISYFTNVDGLAPSQHVDDRLPHLRRRGIEPLVLTSVCGDPSQGEAFRTASSIAPSGIRYELRHRLRKRGFGRLGYKASETALLVPILPLYLLEKLLLPLDSQWSWFPTAAILGGKLSREYRPECIYSTGGPWSAHVAAASISRRTGIPWIAELQDPLVFEDWWRSRIAYRVFSRVEKLVFREADEVVYLTDAALKAAVLRNQPTGKGIRIYAGAEPIRGLVSAPRKGQTCRFAHFGSLGGTRNLEVFLEALERLLRQRPDLVRSVRLEVYGHCDSFSRSLAERFPWPEVITIHGKVSRKRSLEAMTESDVLVLLHNIDRYAVETIPAKTYEYLQAGRRILGLVYRNPELADMLAAQGHASVDASSPESVKAGIARCVDEWENGGVRSEPPAPSPYTVSAAVDSLVDRVDRLLGKTMRAGFHA